MILQATKKPIVITVIRARDIESYREQFHIELNAYGDVWNAKTQEYRKAFKDDYINVTDPNDIYPILGEYFKQNYVVMTDPDA